MQHEQITKLIKQHGNKIKILGLVISIIAMIMAIRTYINYTTIKDAINHVKYNIDHVEQEIAYTNNFLKKYLDSEYADYFLAHKNNILFDGEYIIRFDEAKNNEIETNKTPKKPSNTIDTPQESRRYFIKSKLK